MILLSLLLLLVGDPRPEVTPRVRVADDMDERERCPPLYERSEVRVYSFLSNPLLPQVLERNKLDLGTASSGQIQLLTDQDDRRACEALWKAIVANGTDLRPIDQLAFYRSGDRYLVPINRGLRDLKPGVLRLDGGSSLDMYDLGFNLIARFSS
jgi:hypothetical protein